MQDEVVFRAIGGPTMLLEIGGIRFLTDPTFDPPGQVLSGSGSLLTKTVGPAVAAEAVGPVDVVLLSHDQHADNLDNLGRQVVESAPLVLTTAGAAERLDGKCRSLGVWDEIELSRPDGKRLTVTGVPAQHGPDSAVGMLVDVRGFVLKAADLPTIYISGDNASLRVVREIRDRVGPIDLALLFLGAAQVARIPGANLTLGSDEGVEAAKILAPARIIPTHFSGWMHLTNGGDTIAPAFRDAGLLDRLVLLQPGEEARLPAERLTTD
jgi:L-ascorbate metabolism protein UlaG (beta-lactamase superfamily)